VRQAFALALYIGFLNLLSLPLGPTDTVSAGCRPSQTTHQSVSLHCKLAIQDKMSGITLLPRLTLTSKLQQLPPILYTKYYTTTTSYSKVLRGLRFPLEVTGLHTSIVCSEDTSLGQWQPRYTIHASRHSIGRVLRYLKRIIVIPAVYLSLAPLERSLRYKHWADITSHTHPFGLAKRYVFIKQSGRLDL
jgi:hypothetical protein